MPDQHPARILVIEDNPADVELLRFALNQQGAAYELEILKDGAAALRFIGEHRTGMRQPSPCVIVLDLHLPLHDGITILNSIREAPRLAHLQVIVLSSAASPKERAEIAEFGAFYRSKPTRLEDFKAFAAEIFEICKGAKAVS